MSMLRIQVRPKTKTDLLRIVNPEAANQPECLPWVFFDQQTVITGQATPTNFFAAVQADKTLGNIEQPNTLAEPQFFEVTAFGLDYMEVPDVLATFAQTADLANLLHTSRATFEFYINSKLYARVPATFLTNGGSMSVASAGVPATAGVFNYAQIGIPGAGGYYVDKAIVIAPKQNFTAQVVYGAATTLIASRKLRLWMGGTLYRRVL